MEACFTYCDTLQQYEPERQTGRERERERVEACFTYCDTLRQYELERQTGRERERERERESGGLLHLL